MRFLIIAIFLAIFWSYGLSISFSDLKNYRLYNSAPAAMDND